MKEINIGSQTIKIEASYDEVAKVVQVLDKYWLNNDDETIKKLAYQLQNPKVKPDS
ncbi:hypothetical protein NSQ77_19880 [Oceanobacillus sp. FSL K6-2867]|uniref:hypothetical protein n=1 Tax=Oceanobacillus sp. FSL K6-2867 TaxID=2954748 RepID=UPI0030DCC920